MNLLGKLRYFLIAIIILGLGYLFGTVILIGIGILVLLMSLFFIFTFLLNRGVGLLLNRKVILFIKLGFSFLISFFIGYFLLKIINYTNFNEYKVIISLWVIVTIIFSSFWNSLTIKRRIVYRNNMFNYYEKSNKIQFKDVFFILITSSIIVYTLNYIFLII